MANRIASWSIAAIAVPILITVAGQVLLPASKAEISTVSRKDTVPDTRLVGKFYFGDGFGTNNLLHLKQSHQFTYRHSSCTDRGETEHGHWEQKQGVVMLYLDSHGTPQTHSRYIPVPWGRRLYLVREESMPGFCAAVDEISESARTKGWEVHEDYVMGKQFTLASPEKPAIPVPYQDFLNNGAITGKVISVNLDRSVVLFGKKVSRLKPGMRLCMDDYAWKPELEIISVAGVWARAKQVHHSSEQKRPILPGDIFTTGSFRHRPGAGIFSRGI